MQPWHGIVRAVALDVGPLLAAGHIDFDIETQPAHVLAHEWALRELTRNLLHNAIKHTPARGRLSVQLRVQNRLATLTVSDSGPGIGSDQRTRLFQPFAASGAQGGSGLGLAICREIVQALHGSIELKNREDRGEVLGLDAIVTLPLECSHEP